MRHVDMSTLMLPAATITTMTNTSPIAVAQPKTDSVKGTLMLNNNNNNKQGRNCERRRYGDSMSEMLYD